jgi:hypothetical protein
MDDPRPTLAERYSRAVRSTRLVVEERTQSDADLLIAAGLIGRTHDASGRLLRSSEAAYRIQLAVALYRLAAEYDIARGNHGIAQAEYLRIGQAACAEERRGKPGTDEREDGKKNARALRQAAAAQAMSARAMTLMHLKSLSSTRDHLGAYAQVRATRLRLMKPDVAVNALVGRTLEAWLDPLCHPCGGTGKIGAFGGPQPMCRACSGTGRRAETVGADAEERQFAAGLLAEMDQMVSDVEYGVRQMLRR